MSATGRFRTGIIGPGGPLREGIAPAVAVPLAAAVPGAPAAPYNNWIDRMQRTRSRHAAITRNLYTWSSYKNWSDRVKDTWAPDPAAGKEEPKKGR